MDERINLKDLTIEELEDLFVKMDEPKYRARQVFKWIHQKGVSNFEQMTDLPKSLRQSLQELATIETLRLDSSSTDSDGTVKFKLLLPDGNFIETVLMPAPKGMSVCLSSQVGCSVGCKFCFTAKLGFFRNLRMWEIVDQLRIALEQMEQMGKRLSTVVFMGMGEPLLNVEQVSRAVSVLSHKLGYSLSPRRIVVSTSGITPNIHRLAELPVSVALSLNATDQKTRQTIMPITKKYRLKELLDEIDQLPPPQKKRLMLEYVLLPGVNDSSLDIRRLGRIARRFGAKVNIIPFNPFPGSEFRRPTEEEIDSFAARLRYEEKVVVTVRRSKGLGVYAACGTLAGYTPPVE